MTQEKTPKSIKAIQLVGFIFLAVGVAVRAGTGEYWGTFIGMSGLTVWCVGKALAWWRTG